jgi:hypothetical protein
MKYIWSEQDIICGMFVCRTPIDDNKFEPSSWKAKWMHKIGYQKRRGDGATLICMTDGMVGRKRTPKEMADYLTENDMMPMPHKWVIEMFEYMRDWYMRG